MLRVCLDEIKRSRPFLIALVGDRYGWVPPPERMQAAVDEAGFETEVAGKSVTALEIEFGVLDSTDQKRRSHFYLRAPLPYDEMPPEVAALYSDRHTGLPAAEEAAARLDALKARIERDPSLSGRVHHYTTGWDAGQQEVTGLEEFGRQVLEDLWRDLDTETQAWLQQPDPSWQEQERRGLDEFIEGRGRGFLGRAEITQQLVALADTPAAEASTRGLCVCGESGSGKSALLAHLYRKLQGRNDLLLLAHAAGISPRSTQVDSLLRRWVEELARAVGIDDPLTEESTREEIEEQFAALLSRAATQQRVVLLIDALNQFERTPRGSHLTWLPKLLPPNARLIATTIPGTESEALARRDGIELVDLPLLDLAEAGAIARAVCGRHHRSLNPQLLQILLEKRRADDLPAAGNPLWLELALEELNLLDADDFARAERHYAGTPEARLHQMMLDVAQDLPADIPELYGELLERTEEIHGRGAAGAFADLLALSRHGWRESDLQALLPRAARWSIPSQQPTVEWSDLWLAGLRRSFRAHLVQRGACSQWDFFHMQMRLAVARRSFRQDGYLRDLHTVIADHLETLPGSDPLRQTELMWHLIGTGDRLRTARYYAGALTAGDLAGATRTLADFILTGPELEPDPELEWVTSLLELDELSSEQVHRLCDRYQFDLRDALENDARLPVKLQLVRAGAASAGAAGGADPTNAGWQRDLSVSHEQVGDVLLAQGDVAGALTAYRASLTIRERLAASDPTNADWQRDLSVSHNKVGDVLLAQGDAAGALQRLSRDPGDRRAAGGRRPHQRRVAARPVGQPQQGRRRAAGPGGPGRGPRRLSGVPGDRRAAGGQRSHQRRLAARPRRSATSKVGDVLLAQGDLAGALQRLPRDAWRSASAWRRADPTNAGWQRDLSVSHNKVGDVLVAQGDLAGALRAYRATLAIAERLAAADPTNAGWQRDLSVSHNKVGDVLRGPGRPGRGAAPPTAASLAIARAPGGGRPHQRRLAARPVGQPQQGRRRAAAQGDLAGGAARPTARALAIRERLAGRRPQQRRLAARPVGQPRQGRRRAAWPRATWPGRCAPTARPWRSPSAWRPADPSNAGWQRDLSVSHSKVGDVLVAQGDLRRGAAPPTARPWRSPSAWRPPTPATPAGSATCRSATTRSATCCVAQGDLAGALAAYRAALAIAERLAAADPTNAGWQRDLSVSHEQGRRRAAWPRGTWPGRCAAYRASLAIRERLAAADPSNAGWQRDLSVSHNKIGDVLRGPGRPGRRRSPPTARPWRSRAPGGARTRATPAGSATCRSATTRSATCCWPRATWPGRWPPTAAPWRSASAWRPRTRATPAGSATCRSATTRSATCCVAQGDLAGALSAYRAALAIAERLAASDPTNAGWQRDLSVSHDRIGDVLARRGTRPGRSPPTARPWRSASGWRPAIPTNAGWQRDLSVSHEKVGDVLLAQGDAAGALAAYRASLAIAERLAASDPTNAGWQRDLSVSHNKVGDVLRRRGTRARRWPPIARPWRSASGWRPAIPANAEWQRDLWVSYVKLADLAETASAKSRRWWKWATADPETQQWYRRAYERALVHADARPAPLATRTSKCWRSCDRRSAAECTAPGPSVSYTSRAWQRACRRSRWPRVGRPCQRGP